MINYGIIWICSEIFSGAFFILEYSVAHKVSLFAILFGDLVNIEHTQRVTRLLLLILPSDISFIYFFSN